MDVLIISGSPFRNSKLDKVLEKIKQDIQVNDLSVKQYHIKDFTASELYNLEFNCEKIKEFHRDIARCNAIVIGSPVYKAAISGVLKTLMDLVPERAFQNKIVFPVMLGGTQAHLLAIETSLKPLIHILKGSSTQGVFILNENILTDSVTEEVTIESSILTRIANNLSEISEFKELKNMIRCGLIEQQKIGGI